MRSSVAKLREIHAMQFRLITLFGFVTLMAIAFAVYLRPSELEKELRSDLRLPADAKLTILDRTDANRTIAVSMIRGRARLIAAFKDTRYEGHGWHIPITVGSGATDGVPEDVIEFAKDFDHYPTTSEIVAFRDEFGLNP